MLNSLRSFANSPVGLAIFALLIAGLLFFGLGGFGGTRPVATIGGEEIGQQEFADAYGQQIQQLGVFMTPARALQLQIPEGVLNNLIQLAALRDQIFVMGMGLTDDRVAAEVAADPLFQENGVFSVQRLDTYLISANLTRAELLDQFRNGLLRNQLFLGVRGAEPVLPETYRRILNQFYGEQRAIDFAILTPELLEPGAAPTEEELQAYFTEHAADWLAPEMRNVVLLELSPRIVADPAAVTEEEVAAAYEERRREGETRHVWQQVFPSQAVADAVAAQIAAGQTYEQLVAAGAIAPNDLGVVAADDLFDRAVADAAFAMAPGELRIVAGRAGATLVYLSEIVPGAVPPLAEIADEIRQEIAEGRTLEQLTALTNDVEELRDTGATLTEVGVALNLPTRTVAFDAAGADLFGDPVPDLPGGNAFLTRVLETDIGVATSPVRLTAPGSAVWFEVLEIIPERQLELAEVRDRVVTAWQAANDELRLQTLAESVAALLRTGEPTANIAAELGVTFIRSDLLTRTSSPPEGLAVTSMQAAFDAPLGDVATVRAADGEALVVQRVAEILAPEFDPAAEPPEEITTTATNIADQVAISYVYGLQLRLPISVDMALVRQIIGAD